MDGKSVINKQGTVKAKMKSVNERLAEKHIHLTEAGQERMVFLFGDLDLPITDVMWFLAGLFLNRLPKNW